MRVSRIEGVLHRRCVGLGLGTDFVIANSLQIVPSPSRFCSEREPLKLDGTTDGSISAPTIIMYIMLDKATHAAGGCAARRRGRSELGIDFQAVSTWVTDTHGASAW